MQGRKFFNIFMMGPMRFPYQLMLVYPNCLPVSSPYCVLISVKLLYL